MQYLICFRKLARTKGLITVHTHEFKQRDSSQVLRAEELSAPSGEVLALRYDIENILRGHVGQDWQTSLSKQVELSGREVVRDASHYTGREEDPETSFSLVLLGGSELIHSHPGFWKLYRGIFRNLMQTSLPSNASIMKTYDDPELSMEVVKQVPPKLDKPEVQNRMEAHVDKRYTAILAITTPKSTDSGRLVIASDPNASGIDEIKDNALYVSHRPGTIICFPKGREHPHYTEPIRQGEERVIVSINYPVYGELPQEAEEMVRYLRGQGRKPI